MRTLRSIMLGSVMVALLAPVIHPAGAEATRAMSPGQLITLAKCESGLRPEVVSKGGKYHGLFQFDQSTWNGVAVRAGRPDLAGLKPSRVHFLNQIYLAQQLFKERGRQPWPVCGRRI
jgi:hypothetical protein